MIEARCIAIVNAPKRVRNELGSLRHKLPSDAHYRRVSWNAQAAAHLVDYFARRCSLVDLADDLVFGRARRRRKVFGIDHDDAGSAICIVDDRNNGPVPPGESASALAMRFGISSPMIE